MKRTPLKQTPFKSKKNTLRKKSKKNVVARREPTIEEKNLLRYNVGQRDGVWCFRYAFLKDWPGKFCTGIGQELHHIIPRSNPFLKLWDISNLAIFCTSCHAAYGQNKIFREAILRKLKLLYNYDYSEAPFNEYVN